MNTSIFENTHDRDILTSLSWDGKIERPVKIQTRLDSNLISLDCWVSHRRTELQTAPLFSGISISISQFIYTGFHITHVQRFMLKKRVYAKNSTQHLALFYTILKSLVFHTRLYLYACIIAHSITLSFYEQQRDSRNEPLRHAAVWFSAYGHARARIIFLRLFKGAHHLRAQKIDKREENRRVIHATMYISPPLSVRPFRNGFHGDS